MRMLWNLVAFPLILPWRREFWTLPLYFPDLKVGVIPEWPKGAGFAGMELPPEALAASQELRHYRPGELTQRQAFQDFLKSREEVEDILRELRGQPPEEQGEAVPTAEAWSLAWQLERMQADQEAKMVLVDRGDAWLAEILSPEPWEERPAFGTVPGLKEMMDPELAGLRYFLWRRVMQPYFKNPWAPLLLGRTSRAIFGTLKGWPTWMRIKKAKVSLPGCLSEGEYRAAKGTAEKPAWQEGFAMHLGACLRAAQELQDLEGRTEELSRFVETEVAPAWPHEAAWRWELEIWADDPDDDEESVGPVLCWAGVGADILPG